VQVVAPRAPGRVGLEHDDVVEARAAQLEDLGQPREPRTGDYDLVLVHGRFRR
jgi:hypothetical protein